MKKATLREIIVSALNETASSFRTELVSFTSHKNLEINGETWYYIEAKTILVKNFGSIQARQPSKVNLIYNMNRHEMMNSDFEVIWY